MPTSEVTVSETIYEMTTPTTDPDVVATHRGVLEAAAIAAASAAGELALSMIDANEQGQPFRPAPALIEDFKTSIVQLDQRWRDYVRQTQKAAAPIVNNVIEAYWGADFAAAIETALEGYRSV